MSGAAPRGDLRDLVQTTSVLEIVGDMIRVRASDAALGDLAIVENVDGAVSTARVVALDRDVVSLQVFTGGKGLSTRARVRFLGLPLQVTYSDLDGDGYTDVEIHFETEGLAATCIAHGIMYGSLTGGEQFTAYHDGDSDPIKVKRADGTCN